MIIEGDPEKFLTDFYSKKNNEEISQEKLDSILSTYGDNYDRLISDLYSKYDPEGLDDSKLATIKESYKLAPEESLEQKYLVNGIEVDKAGMTKRLYDDEFVERFQKGEITVDIENDSKLKAIANQQKNSGDAWSDAYESIQIGFNLALQGVLGFETYIEDAINLIGFEDFKFNKILDKEVRNEVSKLAIKKSEKLEKKIRATEGDFASELSNLNFSRAAKMGLNTTLQSVPLMAASMGAAYATGGSSVIAQALAGAGTMTALLTPAEYVQTLVSEDPNIQKLSKGEKFFRGTARGLAEGIPEGIMGPVGLRGGKILLQGLKGLVKKTSIEAGETAAKGLAKELGKETSLEIAQAFGLGTAAEGVTEFTTSLAQDLTDDFLDVHNLGFEKYMRRGLNAGALGIFMGGVVQGSGIALNSGKNTLLRNNSVKQGAVSQIRKEQELGNISKQQGDELIKQIDELQQAVDQTDSELSNEQQEKIANLIYEKNQLNQRTKGLDPNQESVKKAKERILEIDNEISSVSDADIDVASKKVEIEEGIQELKLNKTIKFLESQGKKLGKRTYTVEDEFDADGNLIKSAGEKAQEIYDQYVKENPDTEQMDVSGGDGFKIGNIAVINKTLARQTGAISVGSHETFHFLVDDYFEGIDIEDRRTLIKDFKNLLSKEQLEVVNKRIQDAYMDMEGFDPETSIEWFTAFSDAIELNQIAFNESIGNKILNFVQEVLRKLGIRKEFENARQAYNFMKDYSKSVSKGELSKRALKIAKTPLTKKDVSLSKTASDNVQKIYEEQGVAGALDIIQEFKPIVNKIVQRRSEAPNFDRQLLTDEIETGKRGLLELIQDYNVESGVPLAAYINKFLPARAIEASRRVLGETFTEDVSERVDIAAPEVEIEVKTKEEKVPRSLRKKLNIEKGSDLYNKVKDAVVKTFGTKLPEVTDPKFKKALSDSYKRELKKEVNALMGTRSDFKMFVTNNAETLYKSIPQETINKRFQAFSEPVLDKEGKQVREKTAVGKGVFKKKPFNKEEFINYFLGEDVGASTKGTRKTALSETIADEMALDATMEVIEDPKVFEKFKEIQEIEGKEVPKDIKPKISEKVKRPEGFSFSKSVDEIINIRNLFQLETNGKDKLLKAYGLNESLKIKNEKDIDAYIDMLKTDIFKLGPKEMWFGPGKGTAFTSSSKNLGMSSKNPLWPKFQEKIQKLKNDDTIKYGKPIPGVNTKDIWSLRNKYDKLFKSPEIIEKNIKNGEIKKFNKQVAAIHKTLWERINKEISKDKNKATGIATYLGIVANDTGHWHKLGAQFEGYSKDITGKRYEYEHAMPATAAYLYLLDATLSDVNFSTAYDLVVDNYKLIALDKAMDDKLRNARTAKGYSLQRRMPDDWSVIDNFWWQRYFNDIVSSQNSGIDPNSIIGLEGKTFGEMFNVDASGNSTTIKVEKLKSKAKNINVKNLSNNVVNFSKTTSNEGVIGYAKTVDEALKIARDPNTPVKKIRVFDFDDTLAKSKSLVFYNRPNESGKPVPNNKAIFMIGGPGSGKSNIGKGLQLGRDGWKVVNQDIFIESEKAKQGLPEIEKDYTKEQRSKRAKIGAAGRKAAEAKMDKYTKAGNGMVIDGTGASYNATMKKVNKLKEQGYEVFMVHAKTSNEIALERNRARKERSLPDFIVEKTQESVNNNIGQYKSDLGDNFIEIDTETIEYGKPLPKEFVNDAKARFYATERGKLNAEEFAEQGAGLIEEGFAMDFSDFNIVREGEKGPLFDVAKKIQKARGTDDVFVLTARAPESQQAIHEFLKSEGLEIPLENITGLGNSTGEAKANWLVDKAAEGYNDFYFADDAMQNVAAVKKAMSVLDVKSKVQQAKVKFSKSVNKDFNKIIEQTTGIASEKVYSEAKAKVRGANKGNKKFFIPYSAEDFMGLIYPLLSKGKLGDSQMAWFKKNLLDPYAMANENLSTDRLQLMEDFKTLKKALDVPKDLRKKTDSGFTKEQAVRVYLFNKAGFDVPGISKTDLNELLDLVNSDGVLKAFADQIFNITKGDGYAKPSENWLVGTITTDLIDVLNTVKRAKYLEQSGYTANAELIFSKENLNKLEAAYGSKYREAMENILGRMKSGKNRIFSGNRLSNRVLDYINNSTGAIMFFNTRSAVLQTISAINFLNWSFNNPIKAGAAFANQKQYWKDFVELINSDYLVDRRNGLKLNINESEIADAAATSKNKAKAAINYILQKGFLPTQYADSFAIASGGATFYRNRINDLVKNQGMSEADAKKQAMLEWRQTAEISQQSSDPSKISAQQASDLGRVILAFANTPMQYARIQKRAVQDLANGRGDAKTHVSKIIYYAVVQNLIFNALQSALFKLGFDEEEDEKKEKMYLRTANGMLDSQLRGLGLAGATVAVIKNFLTDIYERSGRKRPEYVDSIYKLLQISPPVSSKISKIRGAAWQFDSKKRREEIFEKGFSIDNPAYEAGAKVISATANIPLDRVYSKVDNISGAMSEDAETWQTIAMLAGWPKWNIMPDAKESSSFNKGNVKIKKRKSGRKSR
jgi:chloramphenicol 3-O-phosphotransferase